MAYYTIYAPADLSDADYRRAAKVGPPAAAGRRSQQEILRSAGFIDIEEVDVTPEFLVTTRAWREGRERYYEELKQTMGEAALAEKLEDNRTQIVAIEEGLLRRSLLTARRPL